MAANHAPLDDTSRHDLAARVAMGLGPATTPGPDSAEHELLHLSTERLRRLAASDPIGGSDLRALLIEHGVSRRRFLAWASATAALLMLPDTFRPRLARAAELTNRIPVIWLEGQDCAGNTEALLRTSAPTIDELLFQTISLEYHETLMSAAGMQAEERKRQAAQEYAGRYVLVIEGSIPNGLDGAYCTIGPQAKPFIEEVKELAEGAALVIAAGACAFYGGIPIASPNPTDAVGVSSVVTGKPVVNIPACPLNPANLMGTILHFTMTGQPPALDHLLRPRFAFGYRIHDNCERRAHFDAGEFVDQWGDDAARNNFVLAARCLAANYTFTPDVEVLDGALLGFGVLDVFDGGGPVVVLDGLAADAPAGTIYRLPQEQLLDLAPDVRLAAHEVEPLQQLRIGTALGTAPRTVLMAMTVAETSMQVGLSPPCAAAFERFLALIAQEVCRWGVQARRIAAVTLDDVLTDLTVVDRQR